MAPSDERKAELVALFLEVTHSSDEAQGAQMLEWYGWEVDRAVSAFMLGDITPPRSYLEGLANPSISARRGSGGASERGSAGSPPAGLGASISTGLDSHDFNGLVGRGVGDRGDAGRHGGRGEPRGHPGVLSVIVGLPFRLLGKVITYALSPINYVLGVEEQPKDGGAAARRFVAQFEAEYGQERKPLFVTESYREAVEEAARQHKFLLVYLHSPLHEDTPQFCRNTLCSAPMVDFMEHNVLVWGGSLMHGEAYAVGNALDACAFPYVSLLLCRRNQVQVVERVEGAENTERLLDRLTAAMARFQEQLERVYRQQREREEARRLREEQDNEYKRGLEEDRRRQEEQMEEQRIREREAEEARERVEKAAALQAQQEQERLQRLEEMRRVVRDEPDAGGNTARIRLQLPNGSKVERRFHQNGTVREIRGFVTLYLEDNNITIKNFSMSTNFPRRTFTQEDDDLSVIEAGLHPTAMLFVHDLDA